MERTGRSFLAILLVFPWQSKCCTELYIEHRGGPCVSVCMYVNMYAWRASWQSNTHSNGNWILKTLT